MHRDMRNRITPRFLGDNNNNNIVSLSFRIYGAGGMCAAHFSHALREHYSEETQFVRPIVFLFVRA